MYFLAKGHKCVVNIVGDTRVPAESTSLGREVVLPRDVMPAVNWETIGRQLSCETFVMILKGALCVIMALGRARCVCHAFHPQMCHVLPQEQVLVSI